MTTFEEPIHIRVNLATEAHQFETIPGDESQEPGLNVFELAKKTILLGIKEKRSQKKGEELVYANIGATMLSGWSNGAESITAEELLASEL